MANQKEKMATCSVCGMQETAEDAQALQEAMQQHMQKAHNLKEPAGEVERDLKETSQEGDFEYPTVPVLGVSPATRGIGPDLGGANYT